MKKLLLLLMIIPIIGFAQCKSGDCKNGYGEHYSALGDYYKGEFSNGRYDGQGTIWSDDDTWMYHGQFEDGMFDGVGKYYQDDYDGFNIWVYIGEWKDDKKNGVGIIKYPDESGYVGYFVNDKLIKTIAEF